MAAEKIAPLVNPSLHGKLADAMASIEWMPKTGRNQQQGYNFVSAERIKDAVRDACAARNVMVYVSTKTIDHSEYTTKSLTTMFHVFVQGEVTFADGDSGEMFTIEAAGEGTDSSDKALNKAITAMLKYALISTFLIPTGDDPDVETPEAKEPARQGARKADGRPPTPSSEPPNPTSAPFRPLGGSEVPVDGEPEPPKPLPRAGMVQCESKSPFGTDEAPVQCRREMGHAGAHRTESETWT